MSEKESSQQKDKSFWLDHLKKAQDFQGSDLEYCRLNNLKASTFSNNKKKFGFCKKIQFKKIEIEAAPLNDKSPEWVARFLKEFLN